MSLILITGGARAGKSTFAERLATQLCGEGAVCYVATAEARDEDMAARIAAHRAARPTTWLTLEAPQQVARLLAEHLATTPTNVVLIDCITLLVSNLLLAQPEPTHLADVWPTVEAELKGLIRLAEQRSSRTMIVVTNEVGLGVVPPTEVGRIYRDLLGRANQYLSAAADEVYLVVAGLAVEIKALATCPSLKSGQERTS